MTKSELDRAVARATGESLATIRSLGFSVLALPADEPQVVDWDELDSERVALFPGRRSPVAA